MFKAGDTVKLKSGGPSMTIAEIEGNQAQCVWFLNDIHQQHLFELDTLVAYDMNAYRGPMIF